MSKTNNSFIKKLQYLFLLSTIILGLLSILGSNGGGGGGDGVGVTTTTGDSTEQLRTYKIGDTLTYQTTLDYTYPYDVTFEGEVTYIIDKRVTNPYGITCLSYTISGTLTSGQTTVPLRNKGLLYQDEEGNLYDCGKYDDDKNEYIFIEETSDTPDGLALSIKNPVTVGDVISMTIYYDDDSWVDCTIRIGAKEQVQTLLGVYNAYVRSSSYSYSNGNTETYTNWLYPSIHYVKRYGSIITSDYIAELTYDLEDYNLAD